MCTAIFAARLFSVLLIASIMGGLLPDNPKYQKNYGKLWTSEESFHLLNLVERMNEKLASQETQMTTVLESMTNLTSLYGTLEQRLDNTEQRLERKLGQDIESLKDKLEQENRILKDKFKQEIGGLKDKLEQENRILNDKLEQEIGVLKEMIKDKPKENCPSDVSNLGIGQELHNFGIVVDGVKDGLKKLTANCDKDEKVFVSHFRNVTDSLDDKINEAADTLGKVSVKIAGRINKSLVDIRDGIEGDAREVIQELRNMTGPLIEQIKNSKELSNKIQEQFEFLNNTLTLGFDGVSSKIDYYNEPRTFENCRKGMQKYTPHYPYPYPIVYSKTETVDQKEFLCDTSTAEGGWIIIQHRSKGDTDFFRGWEDYKKGFGSLKTDFWVGLDTIYKLTSSATYELRIELKYKGESKYAHYKKFSVENEADNYRLRLGPYDGTAGDSLTSWHNGMQFSTKDRDNDRSYRRSDSCAKNGLGAWWYNACQISNLNGKWGERNADGPRWNSTTYLEPATFTEMKIRRV